MWLLVHVGYLEYLGGRLRCVLCMSHASLRTAVIPNACISCCCTGLHQFWLDGFNPFPPLLISLKGRNELLVLQAKGEIANDWVCKNWDSWDEAAVCFQGSILVEAFRKKQNTVTFETKVFYVLWCLGVLLSFSEH